MTLQKNEWPLVRVTQIGEYIRHGSCERRFKLDSDGRRLTKSLPFFYTLSSTMDPVLAEAGREREREWEGHLRAAGLTDLCRYADRPDEKSTPWQMLAERASELGAGTEGYGREIDVIGEIGAFRVVGRIDFVLIRWESGRPRLRLVECKASRKDQTYQRIQLVLYRILVSRLLEEQPLRISGFRVGIEDVECVVARLDENSSRAQDILALPPLDLEMEEADVRLLLAPGGTLQQIIAKDVTATSYQLDSKCDDCALNLYCLPEAARRREIQLLGVDPSTIRALSASGIHDLDTLAALPLDGRAAASIRAHPDFSISLDTLTAKARSRRSTLPRQQIQQDPEPAEHNDVIPLPHSGSGQLPPHETGAIRLIRVYLSVSYDYVENRVGAVSAHVTRSDRPLSTLFVQEEGRWRPDSDVKEQWATGTTDEGRRVFAERPLEAIEFAGVLPKPWSGDYEEDSKREADLLGRFFAKLVQSARDLCPEGQAPLHFYVWSRNEITRLVEACARADTNLLGSLRELLGCREGLEQLIYSCLSDEIDSRYALGWTSRGIAAATALRWFGRRFHWTRRVGDEDLALDRIFAEGIFDFKTTLPYDADGQWLPLDTDGTYKQAFEIRAAFGDALPAPYWRAQWGTLPDANQPGLPDKLKRSIQSYQKATQPGILKAYLKARVQALRWIEEGIKFKNIEIAKPLVDLKSLPSFTLGVETAAQAALDFLWLEQRVAANDWMGAHLVPPAGRVPLGRTLPIRDVQAIDDNKLIATIDLTGYPINAAGLRVRCSLGEGAFVRLSPCDADPNRAQTVAQFLRAGSTCRIESLDWDTGRVELSVLPYRGKDDRYMLPSLAWPQGRAGYASATIDEGLSDFVAGKVDERLESGLGAHVYEWFDPQHSNIPPQTPLPPPVLDRYRTFLDGLNLGHGPLASDQAAAAVDGLSTRVQLLQGPPGTGKTQTTAAAVLLRILARRRAGDILTPGDVVLVAAGTHMAVDTLLRRIAALLPPFAAGAAAAGFDMPDVCLAKAGGTATGEGIEDFEIYGCSGFVAEHRMDSVVVIGGTPNALLKMARELNKKSPWNESKHKFQAEALVVDEASMMVLPPFLALASLIREDGEILLAGDHRQLAPIMSHDWEREDRPPARLYQPYASAYDAVRTLKENTKLPDAALQLSALTFTFRLPPEIRSLIARLYHLDGLTLEGFPAIHADPSLTDAAEDVWPRLWHNPTGLFLVTHDEAASKQSNPLEAEIIARILEAVGTLPSGSVGVVVPHRAQRALLKTTLEGNSAVDVIDTVERLQGGERPTIIVSATASDPAAINARAEFILGLNRANVAFSRAQQRLIVVCSERLISHLPPSAEHYAEAMLWKSLRAACSEIVGETQLGGHAVRVFTAPSK
ncbi:MAG: DEAD/DEAH box helicase [Janthinobacterium lividum]